MEASPLTAVDEVEIEENAATDVRGGAAKTVLASKRITIEDPYLKAHFPGRPVYPGVFVLETVHQAVAAALDPGAGGQNAMREIRSLRLLGVVRPGERLRVRASVVPSGAQEHEVEAQCWTTGGRKVARIRMVVAHGVVANAPILGSFGSRTSIRRVPAPDPSSVLPHGADLVLVDEVEGIDASGRLVVGRTVRSDELCYRRLSKGADPRRHAYPASLLMESFGQAAALAWVMRTGQIAGPDEVLMFAAAKNCRIEGLPYPGDTVHHHVRLDAVVASTAFATGDSYVGSRRLAAWGSLIAVVRPFVVISIDVGRGGSGRR